MDLLCGAKQIQKNVSLRSRHIKNFASTGIKPQNVYRSGTTWCKVTVAELTAMDHGGPELA
jgi:hypothetical protein